jgi:siroheme synthase
LILFCGLITFLALACGLALDISRQQSRIQMIADLAALAGSDSRIGIIAGYPCPIAAEIARVNGANLDSCRIVGGVVSVSAGKNYLGLPLSAKAEAAQKD